MLQVENHFTTKPARDPSVRSPKTGAVKLTLLSRDPEMIAAADRAGVHRIGIDIERLGKCERQKHIPDARISDHELADLEMVADRVRHARVFARLNPLHSQSQSEIETALGYGANSLMLPQFKSVAEPARFIDLVAGRAEVLLLLETAEALECLDEIVRLRGIDELMVGLNDLSLALGMRHPMRLAASPVMEGIAARAHAAGVPFGYGGVACPGASGELPIPADLVLARYASLGAKSAWLARCFMQNQDPWSLAQAYGKLQERLAYWFACEANVVASAVESLRLHVDSALISPQPDAV